MPFNLASGILIYQHSYVTETDFILSIVELILICLNVIFSIIYISSGLLFNINYLTSKFIHMFIVLVQIYNIIYSSFVIYFYSGHKAIAEYLNIMSLVIIIVNSIAIFLYVVPGIFFIRSNSVSLV